MGWCRHDPTGLPPALWEVQFLKISQWFKTFRPFCAGVAKQALRVVAACVAFPHMEARAGCSPVSPCRVITVSRATWGP